MPEAFTPLAVVLRERASQVPAAPHRAARDREPVAVAAAVPPRAAVQTDACRLIASELARLRATAEETLESAVRRLLAALAQEVLGRELRLAPADVAALAARAIVAFRDDAPFGFVVAPDDAAALVATLPVRADPALAPGDLVVEVRGGAYELPLAFRLASAVGSARG